MIKISQSLMKDYFRINNDANPMCRLKFHKKYFEGQQEEPSESMMKGLAFETMLIGKARGGKEYELRTPKTNELSAEHFRLKELAEHVKEMFPIIGLKPIKVQPEYEWKDLINHPDLWANVQGEYALVDVKYTDTAEDDFRRGWGNVQERAAEDLQPVFSLYHAWKRLGYFPKWYYLIVGKSGWVKWVKLAELSESSISNLELQINIVRKGLKNFKPSPVGRFNVCHKCQFKETCEKATIYPEIEEISL